jgi:hypothetical protein
MGTVQDRCQAAGLAALAALAAVVWQALLKWGMLNPYVVLQPSLIARGFIPYVNIEDPRTPLLPTLLSWFQPLFGGDAVAAARVLHAVVAVALIASVVLWAYRNGGPAAAAASGLFFLAWHIHLGYWAVAYYEVILGLVFFGIFLVLDSHLRRPGLLKAALAGILAGLAILIKQHSAVLIAPAVLVFVHSRPRGRGAVRSVVVAVAAFVASGLVLPGLYGLYYAHIGGDFRELWYWTYAFNATGSYIAKGGLAPAPAQLLALVPALLPAVPAAFSSLGPRRGSGPSRAARMLLILFAACALVFVYPRFSGRHLAATVPFLSVLAGLSAADILALAKTKASRFIGRAAVAGFIVWWGWAGVEAALRTAGGPGPPDFSELTPLRPLAGRLSGRFGRDENIVIVPVNETNANLYYLLGKAPPRYHFDFYPWFVENRTIARWLEAVESAKTPKVLLFNNNLDAGPPPPAIRAYLAANYRPWWKLGWNGGTIEILERRKAP